MIVNSRNINPRMDYYGISFEFVEEVSAKSLSTFQDYTVLFLSFHIAFPSSRTFPITLYSFADIQNYPEIPTYSLLYRSVEIFFTNGGKKLYILPAPQIMMEEEVEELVAYLRRLDVLSDLEAITAIDLFDKNMVEESFFIVTPEMAHLIQNAIAEYCRHSSRICYADLPMDFNVEQALESAKEIFDAIVYFPWILNDEGVCTPPSAYFSALHQRLALDRAPHLQAANKRMRNAVDINLRLEADEITAMRAAGLNPVIVALDKGVVAWGIDVLGGDRFDRIDTLRVYNHIRRALVRIGRRFAFEPNTDALWALLQNALVDFLGLLTRKGALIDRGEGPFQIVCNASNNPPESIAQGYLVADITLSLSTTLERINLRMRREFKDEQVQAHMQVF